MEHLQNAELHEIRKRSLTWRLAWKREPAEAHKRSVSVYAYPTCSDRHIRTFFSDFGSTDNLLWLTREWQVVGCTYPCSAFNKKKDKEGTAWKREKPKPHKRSVSVYAYPTCSNRHIRTFFSGFGGTDNLLWLTREWQVVGCTYPSSAFNKEQKAQVVKAVVP